MIREFNFIINKLREETDPVRIIYFFSGTYGVISRAMRYSTDDELLIMHAILNICYTSFNDRLNNIKAGMTSVLLPDNWSEQLADYLTQLQTLIETNESTYPVLEKIMRLSYETTGGGYYVKQYFESLQE